MAFLHDFRVALYSLARTKGVALTVVLTLALGIGANAAIFTLVRGVLLRPLVNRDESRLIYIRQSASGMNEDNVAFSVPEIQDLSTRVKSVSKFGDFSEMAFTMIGLGEPRGVRGGVVSGSFFDVMGLHPVLGRLLDARDDGPNAAGAIVLTYRFWNTIYKGDPSVIGKTVRLESMGARMGTIVGVLEPSTPYPADTEIIANIVTSPHHLSATMVTGRVHRMTELFGRLAPGMSLEQARAELATVYAEMVKAHPEAYPVSGHFQIQTKLLRDQITSPARTILLVLLAAAALVFVIACSNVANLVLARTLRREGELAIRAALGASATALRRMLLCESLLLCGAGAVIGVLCAQPLVTVLAKYAARFSVRALDLQVDSGLLWMGVALAIVAALILAYVPRLPSSEASNGISLSSGSVRIIGSTSRRQRIFAITQIAASFVLLAGATTLVKTLIALQSVNTGLDMHHVLVLDLPVISNGKTPSQIAGFYRETVRRISDLPGVDKVAVGTQAPWRDEAFGPGFTFTTDQKFTGHPEEDPRAQLRAITPGFFAALGVPIVAGRDFNEADRQQSEPVAIISQSVAQRMFPHESAVNRYLSWTDPVMKFVPGLDLKPRRIVGISGDIDDEHLIPVPSMTVYHPFEQFMMGGRLFVHSHSDPYALVTPITRIIRNMSADQPVEHPATLDDIRTEIMTPDRLNSLVFGVFAIVALTIAVVGVAGVLAFSVSSRTREFGIRLALGSQPSKLLGGVIAEGALMAGVGVLAGSVLGYLLTQLGGSYFPDMKMPGAIPVIGAALVLLTAAVVASMLPALRAARVDAMQALHSD